MKFSIFLKLISFALSLFLWMRFALPSMLSYPNDYVVIGGFILTLIFIFFWIKFLIKTINKFSKNKNNENN